MLVTVPIAEGSTCLLKAGQEVDFDTPFLKTGKEVETIIPLSKKLGVPSSKIFRYMKKLVGDTVTKDEVLASKKTLFSETHIKSESEGVLKEINHYEGSVVIMGKSDEDHVIKAFFKGQVESVKKIEITLKLGTGTAFALKKPDASFGGKWLAQEDTEKIAQDLVRTILFAETLNSYFVAKTEAMGAVGYVTLTKVETSLPTAQLKHIEDVKKVVSPDFAYCFVDSISSKMYLYK